MLRAGLVLNVAPWCFCCPSVSCQHLLTLLRRHHLNPFINYSDYHPQHAKIRRKDCLTLISWSSTGLLRTSCRSGIDRIFRNVRPTWTPKKHRNLAKSSHKWRYQSSTNTVDQFWYPFVVLTATEQYAAACLPDQTEVWPTAFAKTAIGRIITVKNLISSPTSTAFLPVLSLRPRVAESAYAVMSPVSTFLAVLVLFFPLIRRKITMILVVLEVCNVGFCSYRSLWPSPSSVVCRVCLVRERDWTIVNEIAKQQKGRKGCKIRRAERMDGEERFNLKSPIVPVLSIPKRGLPRLERQLSSKKPRLIKIFLYFLEDTQRNTPLETYTCRCASGRYW